MKSRLLDRIKANMVNLKEEIKPKTKDEQLNYGLLKSSENMQQPQYDNTKTKKAKDKTKPIKI